MDGRLLEINIEKAFKKACLAELQALKPGNVHIYASGHDMTVLDFEKSTAAAAPFIAAPKLTVGERIDKAVQATYEAVGCNTNLGILLLAAPLTEAALTANHDLRSLREKLQTALNHLTVEDTEHAYQAIRRAEPGGIGRVEAHDIFSKPTVTLLEAMAEAQSWDRIAWQYTHGYEDIFAIGLARLEHGLERWEALSPATAYAFLGFLGAFPDSLIQRKYGKDVASEIRCQAQHIDDHFSKIIDMDEIQEELLLFDQHLKSRHINPGTSADLTVASLFIHFLQAERKNVNQASLP